MRKLRTFYRKVTKFLNDDKIAYLHRLGVIVIINVFDVLYQLDIYTDYAFVYAFLSLAYVVQSKMVLVVFEIANRVFLLFLLMLI